MLATGTGARSKVVGGGVTLKGHLRGRPSSESGHVGLKTSATRRVKDRDPYFLGQAIKEAQRAIRSGELPYGAVVVDPDGVIVARAHDTVVADRDLTSHAEILAVRRAAEANGPDLSGHTLYATCEPCSMCFSAAWTARLSRLVFGITMRELKAGYPESMDEIVIDSFALNKLGSRQLEIVGGVLRDDCLALWS